MSLPRVHPAFSLLGVLLLVAAASPVPAPAQEPPGGTAPEQTDPPREPGEPISAEAEAEAESDEAAAESEETPPRGVFEEAIQVKVVNVQVFVRDKRGNPITGLTKDDFELFEDGKPVPITNFYEVREGERTDRPEEPEESGPGVPIRTHPELDPRASQVPEDERLHLIIYIDNFNIRPFNRNRVFRHLREFLRTHVSRADRVMLVSYNRSLKVERGFTSDPTLISNALYGLEKHTGGRVQLDSEERDLLRDIDEARDPLQMEGRIRMHAESVYNDLQFTLDSLKELTMSLAGIPGRKAVLYVSDGLPMRPGEEFFYAADDKVRESAGSGSFAGFETNLLQSLQYDASRRFRDLTNAANANDVTFYTLDAAGLRTSSLVSAESRSYNTNFSTTYESIKVQNLQSTLLYMADRTGGEAIINTNNVSGGLERVAADFTHYYSLGYSPGHAGNGRAYKIEVEVNQKGARVRHRMGYRDKSVETEMADRTLASLRYGYENNEMGIQLERGEEIRRSDGNYVVHLLLKIPIGELELLPTSEGYLARVRVWVQAADDEGGISPVQANVVQWSPIPEDELERARQGYYVYQLPLIMRDGQQRLSIGVRDDLAARTSFLNRALLVGS